MNQKIIVQYVYTVYYLALFLKFWHLVYVKGKNTLGR